MREPFRMTPILVLAAYMIQVEPQAWVDKSAPTKQQSDKSMTAMAV